MPIYYTSKGTYLQNAKRIEGAYGRKESEQTLRVPDNYGGMEAATLSRRNELW